VISNGPIVEIQAVSGRKQWELAGDRIDGFHSITKFQQTLKS